MQPLSPSRRAGSVLVLVIWVLFLLSAIAVALGARVSGLLAAAQFSRDRAVARARAMAAVATAQAVCRSQTNEWDGPVEGSWTTDPGLFAPDPEAPDRGSTYFTGMDGEGRMVTNSGIVGIEGRINVNTAEEPLLVVLFNRIGDMQQRAAEAAAKEIVAARKGEARDGLTAGDADPYAQSSDSKGRDLATVWELQNVVGIGGSAWLRLAPYVTVLGSGKVNLNAAAPQVLACVFEASAPGQTTDRAVDSAVGRILAVREAGKLLEGKSINDWLQTIRSVETLTSEDTQLIQAAAKWATVGSSCWEGTARGASGGTRQVVAHIDFVIDGQSGDVVQWREW